MLNDIKNTLFNITRSVSKTGGTLVKTTKLSVTLAQEQDALKNLYIEIGRKVHEIYQYGGSLGKFFDEKYHEIEGLERKIDELKEEIAKVKGVKECPKCGKQVDKNAEFCPKCGLRLDGATSPIPTAAAEPYTPPTGPFATVPPLPEGQPDKTSPTIAAPPIPEIRDEAPTDIPQPHVEVPPPITRTCRACGAENDAATKFCLTCGRYL